MPERAFATQSKRGIDVTMTEEDDVAFMELLRQNFSPLVIVCVKFREEELELMDTLPPEVPGMTVYITNPDPGDELLDRLQTALLFCERSESEIFRNVLPRRHVIYHQSHGVDAFTTKLWGSGQPVEVLDRGCMHFTYDRTDLEVHRFTNKVLRLLKKMLVNRFAVVDAETGQTTHLNWLTHGHWVGPGALESCRRHRHRYLGVGPKRDKETRLFLAPMSSEAYAKQRSRPTGRAAHTATQSSVVDETPESEAVRETETP